VGPPGYAQLWGKRRTGAFNLRLNPARGGTLVRYRGRLRNEQGVPCEGGVATATAAVLGIELKTRLAQNNNKVGTAVSSLSRPVWIGVVVFLVVGVFIGIVWLTHQDIAPPLMQVFALMTVGWLVGILVAALKASSND
jgi:hypothetical protein